MHTNIPRVLWITGWRDHEITMELVRFSSRMNWHLDLTNYTSGEIPEIWTGDGIIAVLGENKDLTAFIRTMLPKIPIVSMSIGCQSLEIPYVDIDNEEIGKIAALHFLERYFQNFAFYSHVDWAVSQLRGGSYSKYIEEAGHSCKKMIWTNKIGRKKNTWKNREKWLRQELQNILKPLSVFAVDDLHAMEIIEVCMKLGYKIPEDVAILGVGNSDIFSYSTIVGLSSIYFDNHQLVYETVGLLEKLMQGQKSPKWPILLKPLGIKTRKSTETFATDNPELNRSIRFILDNYHRQIYIKDIVDTTYISQTKLYELFNDTLNQSPARFLTAVRLERAKQLLRESNIKINTIAQKCGFMNKITFYRIFRRFEKITPNEYRKSMVSS